MSAAGYRVAEGEPDAAPEPSPLARLQALRALAVAANPQEEPVAAPSPLRAPVAALEQPRGEGGAWAGAEPPAAPRDWTRLAIYAVLGAIALIITAGIVQHVAQGPAAAAPRAALRQQVAVAPPAAVAPSAAPVAAQPAPTTSPRIAAIKDALQSAGPAQGDPGALSGTEAPASQPETAPPSGVLDTSNPDGGAGWSAPPAPQPAKAARDGGAGWGAAQPQQAAAPQPAAPQPLVGFDAPAGAPIVWPVVGPMTSCFCPYHPLGIDIAVPLGTPVHAMAAGRIAFVGGNACCSYGYYVDIDHGNGIMTRYGHLSYIPAIPVGTPVRAGDIIGVSGTTGYSTGPHLHFEVRLNGVPVNPLAVLP